ncbi:MAG: hypothetical protein MUD14_24050 [Hydrococcus sp. Prado102]|nr:hypothetical protein [Hydrococcus sp. Prado102]
MPKVLGLIAGEGVGSRDAIYRVCTGVGAHGVRPGEDFKFSNVLNY